MAVQTTYNETQDALRLGHIYDTGNKDLVSRSASGGAIQFGTPVVEGTADRTARVTAVGDTNILGIVARDRSALHSQFEEYADMRVVTKGPVAVTAVVDVVAGDPVHVIVADGTFSNTGGVELNAAYESSGTAGELVKVRLA